LPYYLSVTYFNLSAHKQRQRTRRGQPVPPPHFIGVDQAPDEKPGGLVALVDDDGGIRASLPVWGVDGVVLHAGHLLAACPWDIKVIDHGLTVAKPWATQPAFNHLHSIRRSGDGVIVASSGVDALVELDAQGAVRWQWWATDHGLAVDPRGIERHVDPGADHRGFEHDTRTHTTHVNSAIRVDERTVLATLFRQNSLVAIDTRTGTRRTVFDDLHWPHSVRQLDGGLLSVVDTRRGRVVVLRPGFGFDAVTVEASIHVDTDWLQDACFDGERWWLVDGWNSRVVVADAAGRLLGVHQFDPDWRLYEALPCDPPH
jgi:hypothetical protein